MEKQLISEVSELYCKLLKRHPPILMIDATGTVNSGGWTEAELRFVEFKDGIAYFDFYAHPPEGSSTQVMTEINCNALFDLHDPVLTKVVVRSENNSKEFDFQSSRDGNKAKPDHDKNIAISPSQGMFIRGYARGLDFEAAMEDAVSKTKQGNALRTFEIFEQWFTKGGITGGGSHVILKVI